MGVLTKPIQFLSPYVPPGGGAGSLTITTKFAGDVNSTSGSGNNAAATVNCGTVTTGAVLIVSQIGTVGTVTANIWVTPVKSSGTATIGAASLIGYARLAVGASEALVSSWSIPVTSGGTLMLTVDDSNNSFGYGVFVDEVTGADPTTPIVGVVTQTSGSGTATDSTLTATPTVNDILYAVCDRDCDAGANSTVPASGWTERSDINATFTVGNTATKTSTTSTLVAWSTQTGATAYTFAGVAFIIKAKQTSVAYYQVADWATTYTSGAQRDVPVTGISWAAGDVIVVSCGSDSPPGATADWATPTNANLTFTPRQYIQGIGADCAVGLWTAIASTSQSAQTITGKFTLAGAASTGAGACVWVVTPAGVGSVGFSILDQVESLMSLPVRAGSVVCYAGYDFGPAASDETPVTGSGTATERRDGTVGSNWAQYIADWLGTSAGTFTFGPSTYAAWSVTQTVIEITTTVAMFFDDFNRANGDPGANWTANSGTTKPTITSNKLVTTGSTHGMYWSANTLGADQFSEADVDGAGTSTGTTTDVYVRSDLTTDNEYTLGWRWTNSGEYVLDKWVGGVPTTLGSLTGVGITGVRRLRIQAVGTTIKGFVNGVELFSVTDTSHASGKAGNYWGYITGTRPTMDNFVCGDL